MTLRSNFELSKTGNDLERYLRVTDDENDLGANLLGIGRGNYIAKHL